MEILETNLASSVAEVDSPLPLSARSTNYTQDLHLQPFVGQKHENLRLSSVSPQSSDSGPDPDPTIVKSMKDPFRSHKSLLATIEPPIPSTNPKNLVAILHRDHVAGANSEDGQTSGDQSENGERFKRKKPRNPEDGVSRYWTDEEHARFLSALNTVRPENDKFEYLSHRVGTRTALQTRTHYQKWVQKVIKATKKTVLDRKDEKIYWKDLDDDSKLLLEGKVDISESKTSKISVPDSWGIVMLSEVLEEIKPSAGKLD